MSGIRNLTQAERDELLKEVREEFPNDRVMQDVHFARLINYYSTRDMTPEERREYYNQAIPENSG